MAVDVDDRLIFKFPRHADGEAGLRLEARILQLVADSVTMPVPRLTLFDHPRLFSRHDKIPGEHLLTAEYEVLDAPDKQDLAERMGQFHAELHAIELAAARHAGAEPLPPWSDAEQILQRAWPVLPESLRGFAERTMAQWAALAPDPHGARYGFFDGHGWNMAFDHERRRLNGVYDFGDSGIGPLHQEFIYSSLISPDLTARIIAVYERHTGLPIDRDRVAVLTGTHRLWELAEEAHLPEHVPDLVASVADWARLEQLT